MTWGRYWWKLSKRSTFVKFIALNLQHQLKKAVSNSNFFSIQLDTSTDCGNFEEELFLMLYFDAQSPDGMVNIQDNFLLCGILTMEPGKAFMIVLRKLWLMWEYHP